MKMAVLLLLSLYICVLAASPISANDEHPHYLNQFLIKVEKREIAEEVAKETGFSHVEELEGLGYHLLTHPSVSTRSKRHAVDHVEKLRSDPRVQYVEQQKVLIRDKRDIVYDKQLELESRDYDPNEYYRVETPHLFRRGQGDDDSMKFNDTYFNDQWYCKNTGQSGGYRDVDLNVMMAWKMGYTGTGVKITVLDDGVDHTHKDLAENYNKDISADFNDPDDEDNDPTPNKADSSNSHGTKCAGEIAAIANNGICAVGIAHNSQVGGIRILDGDVTDHLEAKALNYKMNLIDIMSASWGPRDNGATMEMPGRATQDALRRGVKEGRNGKGTIFVWATGNGGVNDDDCGADGYVSSIETLSIGSVNDRGQAPYFMELCSSTFAVVPSGGETYRGEFDGQKPKIKVVTTNINNECTLGFEGTSAAAPLASGCVALALQANPDLTWRDIQHLVADTARIPSVDNGWIFNGAGKHVSHKFGFGVLDCGRMVECAQTWKPVKEQHQCLSDKQTVNMPIPSRQCIHQILPYKNECYQDKSSVIFKLEHVQLVMDLDHSRRGDVEIFLTSPSGTESQMLSIRSNDHSSSGIKFVFMTIHTWDEDPRGNWKISVCDNKASKMYNKGTWNNFQVIWYGTDDRDGVKSFGEQKKSFKPSLTAVKEEEKKELARSKRLKIKRQDGLDKKNMESRKKNKKEIEEERRENLIAEISQILKRQGYQKNHVDEALKDLGESPIEKKGFQQQENEDWNLKRNFDELHETTKYSEKKEREEEVAGLYDRVLHELAQYIERRELMKKEKSLIEKYYDYIGLRDKRYN